MKRLVITLVIAAALLVAPPLAGASVGQQPPVLTKFCPAPYGAFAESMASDSHGNLIVSVTRWGLFDEAAGVSESNTGEIWKVNPWGHKTRLAKMDLSPFGQFMGVALDRCDRIYVAVMDFAEFAGQPQAVGSGVLRLDARGVFARVALLLPDSLPNGLAVHDGRLYVSDMNLGAIWRVPAGPGVASPTEPWAQDDLLLPSPDSPFMIGANGIAFKGRDLYVDVSDYGRVVRIPVRWDGSPGTPSVLCEAPELVTADGIAFDLLGRLWVVTNGSDATPSGGLYRVSCSGAVTKIAADPGWLDYPTMPVFGRTLSSAFRLYILNGAFYNYSPDGNGPSIVALKVGVPGLPLR